MNIILKKTFTTPKKRGQVQMISPQKPQKVVKSLVNSALLMPTWKPYATQRK